MYNLCVQRERTKECFKKFVLPLISETTVDINLCYAQYRHETKDDGGLKIYGNVK